MRASWRAPSWVCNLALVQAASPLPDTLICSLAAGSAEGSTHPSASSGGQPLLQCSWTLRLHALRL